MGREFIAGLMVATCFYMAVVLIVCLIMGNVQFPHGGF